MSPIRHPLDGSFAANSWAAVMSAAVREKRNNRPWLSAMNFRRSAATGAADGLLAHSALAAGGGTLNFDGGAVDGPCVIRHDRHQRVEDCLPAPTTAPAVEAVIDRGGGFVDRRTVLPATATAQDMNDPTNDPPVVLPACAGVDLGKKRLNRRPGFVSK